MRKILFTLIVLMTASSAFADCYLYINDFEIEEEQLGQMIEIPVSAYFDARVDSFAVDIELPQGLELLDVYEGEDMYFNYLNKSGSERPASPGIVVVHEEEGYFHCEVVASVNAQQGFWKPTGSNTYECYGNVKWEAGEYDAMLYLSVKVDESFSDGEIFINTTPTSKSDTRGGAVIENGDNGQSFFMNSWVWLKMPEITETPTICIVPNDDMSVAIYAEGKGDVHLYINGEEVDNPSIIYFGTEEYYLVIMATAQEDGKLISEEAIYEYVVPPLPVLLLDVSISNTADSTIVTILTDADGCFIRINGEEYQDLYNETGEITYAFARTNDDQVYDFHVETYGSYGYAPNSYDTRLLVPALGNIYDFEQDGIYYKIIGENRVAVSFRDVNYNCYSGDVAIPASVNNDGVTYQVVAIRSMAFNYCRDLLSVEMPNSINAIGNDAFNYCYNMDEVNLPDNLVTIGDYAFHYCRDVAGLSIPASVVSIGNNAFSSCYRLKQITIPASVTSIGDEAFYNCTNVTEVTMLASGASVGEYAFSGCSRMTRVNIADLAAWCSLQFADETANPLFNARHLFMNDAELKQLNLPAGITTIGNYAFVRCPAITQVTIPNSVTIIGNNAFNYCYGLTSITIPDSVVIVGPNAFSGCTGLKSVRIGKSVESIWTAAFSGCSGLTSIVIPASVSSIDAYAFNNCNSLVSVTCLAITPPATSYGMFSSSCYSNATLHVPMASVEAYQTANYWKQFAHVEGIPGAGLGDVDGDGEIAINDVITLIDALIKGEDVSAYGDLNGDGIISIADITDLIDQLLSHP